METQNFKVIDEEFVCENCGGKNGRLKEGKKLITIQCSSCKYTNIVFEKHTSNIGVQSEQNRHCLPQPLHY